MVDCIMWVVGLRINRVFCLRNLLKKFNFMKCGFILSGFLSIMLFIVSCMGMVFGCCFCRRFCQIDLKLLIFSFLLKVLIVYLRVFIVLVVVVVLFWLLVILVVEDEVFIEELFGFLWLVESVGFFLVNFGFFFLDLVLGFLVFLFV